jgi:predicted nucleotidyltransferase
MTDLGLTSRDLATMNSIFRKYPGIERVRVFGSRAKGNYRK